MSSSISIGFVFEQCQSITSLFSEFLRSILKDGELQKITYSLDKDGNTWFEEKTKPHSAYEVATLMVESYYGKVNVDSKISTDKKINFDISISKFSGGDYAFLIEIDINQLFKVGNEKDLKNCSFIIIEFCKDIFNKIKYRYAFCDHEVNVQYTWREFRKIKEKIYSISIIPQNKDFKISLAPWEIDGLTSRNQ